MNKLCCCDTNEVPSFTLKISCPSSCCESRLQGSQMDETDFKEQENKEDEDNDNEETLCCCFIRKRHAKVKKTDDCSDHGAET